MSDNDDNSGSKCPFANLSRRNFFKAVGGLGLFAAGAGAGIVGAPAVKHALGLDGSQNLADAVPFYGMHQAGITTPQQSHSYFASFDLMTDNREAIVNMLKSWTDASAKMTGGNLDDSSLGLPHSRLTMTFGFGPGLFSKDGKDRYGLASRKPAALVDLPKFNGDQLMPERSGGDISVQACADDPQVTFHAIRQIVKLAGDVAKVRWSQIGFTSGNGRETPRNLQGFKDGTQNPQSREMAQFVWAGAEGPGWMQDGSYLVFRRIRIALEHWDKTDVDFQEQVIGRNKLTGAPLSGKKEFDAIDLNATDKDGNYLIPENSHVRLASAAMNNGAQILRRGYSYNDGANYTAERWPPWRQGIEYDAGLLFVCYQKDPRTGFIKIFNNMAKMDMLNQFTTHTASAVFACPGGVMDGEFIGQRLFTSA